MKKLTIFLSILYFQSSYSQDRTFVYGKIISDSFDKANINILNKNTQKGTSTDIDGKFEIKVKVNDVLVFSAVQFETVRKIISETDILNKTINIKMVFFINKLNIVTIKNHNLTASLFDDSKNVPVEFKKNNTFKLELEGIDFTAPGLVSSIEDLKPPDPLITSETPQLLDFVRIYKFITKGLRKKRKAKIAHRESLKLIPLKIREEYGDIFFIDELKIPKPLIDDFINFCKPKNIISLYHQNEKYKVITILIEESQIYLKTIGK